jgi:hypothetical protein
LTTALHELVAPSFFQEAATCDMYQSATFGYGGAAATGDAAALAVFAGVELASDVFLQSAAAAA